MYNMNFDGLLSAVCYKIHRNFYELKSQGYRYGGRQKCSLVFCMYSQYGIVFWQYKERFVETVCNVGLSHVLAILVLRRYTPIDNPPFDIELDNHLPKYSYR